MSQSPTASDEERKSSPKSHHAGATSRTCPSHISVLTVVMTLRRNMLRTRVSVTMLRVRNCEGSETISNPAVRADSTGSSGKRIARSRITAVCVHILPGLLSRVRVMTLE